MQIKVKGGRSPEFYVVDGQTLLEAALEIYQRQIPGAVLRASNPYIYENDLKALANASLIAAEFFFKEARTFVEHRVREEEKED